MNIARTIRTTLSSGLIGAGILTAAACHDAPEPIAPRAGTPELQRTELAAPNGPNSHIYVVRFRQDIPDSRGTANRLAIKHGGRVRHVYTALKGMAIVLPDSAVNAMRAEHEILSIVPDGTVGFAATQTSPPWGLDRIDQRNLPLSNTYTNYYDGSGVTIYIIDTGINPYHNDFGGRASVGYDATGGDGIDCNGHGTHVAGIAGGSTYGVAKNVQIIGVKVFPNCADSADWNDFIAGVDWVTSNKTSASAANVSLVPTCISSRMCYLAGHESRGDSAERDRTCGARALGAGR